MRTILFWIAFIVGGVAIGLLFYETIWALLFGLALLVGIPAWAAWSTSNDRTRQSQR